MAFHPDGQHLASGSADCTVKLWNINIGENLYTLNNHSDWVNSVDFSPDGKTLVSGSRDITINRPLAKALILAPFFASLRLCVR
ncbi:MAG: hypothetical protein RMX96_14160 [Nostoc sp. ChiSLP02]|nr:hypothetical protein [Nostoc sp. DedSLP05]MDZ8099761.1 hypothetical protein [Nostoc sp. DedSLP01]MDZ8185982.1 hypothetical protein [Nostoc sp. ChiSLP02]